MSTAILISISIMLLLLLAAASKEERNHNYSATFGDPSKYLNSWNSGFAIGNRAFSSELSRTNLFLAGPTGSGKSSLLTIPCAVSLSRKRHSIIFNDVSGELWKHTSQYLSDRGYKVLRLDFSNSQYSESFNPLIKCKSISDIQKLSLIIVQNAIGESKGEAFWENSSIMLLSLFARYLVFHTEPQFRTLQNLHRLIERFSYDFSAIDKLIVATKDEGLITAYKSTIVMGDRTLQSVIATARTAMNLFNDPEVCKTTAANSIDFTMLREMPVAIYVCNPLQDLRYFKPLSALFFQSLFNFVLSRIPEKNERDIFIILDEFASMKFPDIAVTISNIRKYAGMLLCVQDEMSLIANYGQAEAHQIRTNCGIQCFLKGSPTHTSKELSQIFGKYTYEDEKGNTKTRELMTPDEVRMCEEVLILVNNQAPLKIKAQPYYKNFWLRQLNNSKPFELSKRNITDPAIIHF